jgi:hypothetical protein
MLLSLDHTRPRLGFCESREVQEGRTDGWMDRFMHCIALTVPLSLVVNGVMFQAWDEGKARQR